MSNQFNLFPRIPQNSYYPNSKNDSTLNGYYEHKLGNGSVMNQYNIVKSSGNPFNTVYGVPFSFEKGRFDGSAQTLRLFLSTASIADSLALTLKFKANTRISKKIFIETYSTSLNFGSFGNLTPLLILPSALAFTYLYISST